MLTPSDAGAAGQWKRGKMLGANSKHIIASMCKTGDIYT